MVYIDLSQYENVRNPKFENGLMMWIPRPWTREYLVYVVFESPPWAVYCNSKILDMAQFQELVVDCVQGWVGLYRGKSNTTWDRKLLSRYR